MPDKRLNVNYCGVGALVNTTGKSENIRLAIKELYGERIPAAREYIILYDKFNQMITDYDHIPDEYFQAGGPTMGISYMLPPKPISLRMDLLPNSLNGNLDWIDFNHAVYWPFPMKIYVRQSFPRLVEAILSSTGKVMITSFEGAGKSVFLMYLSARLVSLNERVLLIQPGLSLYYDGSSRYPYQINNLPSFTDSLFWNKTLWCLYNERPYPIGGLEALPYNMCKFVWVPSPKRELLRGFVKPPTPLLLTLPLWSTAEIARVAELDARAAIWLTEYGVDRGEDSKELEIHNWR